MNDSQRTLAATRFEDLARRLRGGDKSLNVWGSTTESADLYGRQIRRTTTIIVREEPAAADPTEWLNIPEHEQLNRRIEARDKAGCWAAGQARTLGGRERQAPSSDAPSAEPPRRCAYFHAHTREMEILFWADPEATRNPELTRKLEANLLELKGETSKWLQNRQARIATKNRPNYSQI